MNNMLAVVLAVLGLFAATFGGFGLDVALVVSGTVLFFASVLLLYDLPGGDR